MKLFRSTLPVLCFLAPLFFAHGSSVLPVSTRELVERSDAICRGTIVGISSFKETTGLIYTRTLVRVDEALKGKFPDVVQVVHRGGRVGNEDEFFGLSPRFANSEERLLFLTRGADGRLQCAQGPASAVKLQRDANASFTPPSESLLDDVRALTWDGELPGADVTDQAAEAGPSPATLSGMLGGIPSRFVLPDRGEPIPYLIDADTLPAGITLTQATNAVQQALNAWAAVTSLKFKFEGFKSFGQGADTIAIDDGKLRIQLHDNYNSITGPNVLGIGGRNGSSSPVPVANWDIGGNVAGNEFWLSTHGFVVLEATNSLMQTLSTFTEVLCHEIGHSINMAHSSENPSEPDPVLNQAIMYFQAHADGRGATLGVYDPPIIRQVYPTNNTPPFFIHPVDRVMDITTASTAPGVAGINEIDLSRSDLQGSAALVLTNITGGNGTFSQPASLLRFTPIAVTGARVDPSGNTSYGRVIARASDGTNASPYVIVKVVSLNLDTVAPSDGIPDSWMVFNFGNANPNTGPNHHAGDDFDGDHINNINEYRAGMSPTNSNSAQRVTLLSPGTLQWQAKAYEAYEIQASSNLINWSVVMTVVPTNAPPSVLTDLLATNILAVVSNLPASDPKTFYRVLKVP